MPPTGQETFSPSLEMAENYKQWVIDSFRAHLGRAVLEIGVGDGDFHRLIAGDATYVGLDNDPEILHAARRRNPHADYIQGDIADTSVVDAVRKHISPDTIVCLNVLEHLPDDRAAAHNLCEMLEPGGRLLLQVPAHERLYTSLDRLAGHRRRYRLSDLRDILPAEMTVLTLEYFNPLGAVGWWLNHFIRHQTLDSSNVSVQIVAFDRLVLPVSRWLNPLSRRFFGQSVVCVAQKP